MKIFERFAGDPKFTSLEFRLFNSITFVNAVLNILGSFFVFHLPNSWTIFAITFGSGLIFLMLYYLSRFKNLTKKLFWPFSITLLTYLSINWFTNSGSTGGAHYYIIPALVIATILLENHQIVAVYLVFLAVISGLFYIEYFHPELMIQYSSREERYIDVYLNYSFVLILNGILIFILVQNLNVERKKSESLLLNILPESIADELKKYNFVKPASHTSVSVLFCDMVGFTKIAESMSPSELISELDYIFTNFDRIVKKHKIEKIKTIGDSYMAVAGLPNKLQAHAIYAVLCALDLVKFMEEFRIDRKKNNRPCWEFRLGIHSGDVVAGVVGKDKFAYDIWGDTVNTASRLESSGVIGKVNVSKTTYDLVHEYFECESRGKIDAKNKGPMEMFLVHGLKNKYINNIKDV
ncbi:adenylate/guanylate cyclase domain-containing protein [Leptospira sp. GIMC2001]|uniref:adenylate/guanylate cyclase domain-containing protein n=1 Tax=Leptospira sp. GIMC2001 TaxID=1513297 RepID=UPI00234B8248|nr:adenylate/guanylate cyclase domain-containing protein [Leptospira sp. GIMC2001]WCL47586.1 adenylate/guanylate cyclase domain-containing protein [Leptospira sp. GIMC2001]